MPATAVDGSEVLDVAIVGGGASGAYTAYRLLSPDARESPVVAEMLKQSGRDTLDVLLFEGSDRIGGRLWSVDLPGLADVPAEVGGMRFLQSQQNVFGLSTKLGLTPINFGFFNNIQYLRTSRFEFSQYSNRQLVPYRLFGKEIGQNPIQIVINAIDAALPGAVGLKGTALIDYLRKATVDGVPLYKIGFWTLLAKHMSIEAYHLVLDASGYFTIYGNWSAYAALLEFLRNYADSTYFRLPGGYQGLPLALVDQYKGTGGKVQMGTRVRNIAPDKTAEGEDIIRLDLVLQHSPVTGVRYARAVVLAMPQRSFELLDPTCFLFNGSPFRTDIQTVSAEPASKLFLTFDTPWWQKLTPPITTGRSDTDLPIRQCYYVGTETSGPDAGMSLLMASYNDGTADSYWDTYLSRSAYGPNEAPYVGRHHGSIDQRLEAPHEMVMDAHRQLCEMHGVQVPLPVDAIYHSWQEDPIGAGWYFWNPHVVSWEVAPRVRHPRPGHRVFTCGSCYSENQGWVEGALNTAEMMLEEAFKFGRPGWVSADYYMGP